MAKPRPPLSEAAPKLPEGFRYRPELTSPSDESSLIARVRELPFKEFEFHGYTGKRRTVSLSGPARSQWEHSIPRADALRYSVTFRNLRGG